jgi:hypothetical protein
MSLSVFDRDSATLFTADKYVCTSDNRDDGILDGFPMVNGVQHVVLNDDANTGSGEEIHVEQFAARAFNPRTHRSLHEAALGR